jgi:hypothetical protein
MPSTYKTPDVYVEEITKFPPSVASVETAIPAFIGHTEIAEKNGESLTNIPTRISSFLEFEQYFGGPPPRDVIVRLNSSFQYLKAEHQGTTFLLYDSIRLFYNNGGGICYIVSVNNYLNPPIIGDDTKGILGGLKTLEKYDELTLILSPDATYLGSDLYTFQVQAINQCNKLQDRFLICDLLKSDEKTAGQMHDDRISDFRDNIGINYLKYAAAYTPWLRTSLDPGLRFRDIIFAMDGEVNPTTSTSLALLTSLTNNPSLLQLIFDLSNAIAAVDALNNNLIPGGGGLVDAGVADLNGQLKLLLKNFMVLYNDVTKVAYTDFTASLTAIYARIRDIIVAVQVIYASLPAVVATISVPSAAQTVEFKLKNNIDALIDQAKSIVSILVTHHREIVQKTTAPGPVQNIINTADPKFTNLLNFAGFPGGIGDVPNDPGVQAMYRIFAIKKALILQLNAIANSSAGTSAANALALVVASIPLPGDLKTKVDTELTTAKGGAANVAAVITALNTKLGLPATSPADKVILTIAKTYADEENKVNAPANVADLVPDPPGFPVIVANALNQIMQDARQKATLAASAAGAVKNDVKNALTFSPVDPKEYTLIASGAASSAGGSAITYFSAVLNAANNYESVFDQSLLSGFGTYKTFVTKAGQELMILPPGSAIAGVYASVDSDRGVWKAPANISLASVLGPLILLNSQDQESLNVDTNAGKSINVIRAFTGKGTLVWGTRTLAGNDNEWRYVPVRRFFNYAEESIKKATEPFVFEPNDINTWIRVRAMIENFLTLEWRRGALAGAKATDSFYVKVGLGETMTSLDILEGRMIVEVGMAVVRPAEFIILRFAHKMQES